MAMPFVMNQDDTTAMQRPRLPNTDSLAWTPHDRLYRSVTLDYVSGMSQSSYLFTKANQETYRPMLEWALDRAGLLALTPGQARYALQVEFVDLRGQAFGVDFAGRSNAVYRIVDRFTGSPVFEDSVESNFVAMYPELNESDFARAFAISKPGVKFGVDAYSTYAINEALVTELVNNNSSLTDFFGGPITEASQSVWNDVTQVFVWTTGLSLVSGPLNIVREQLDPSNYIALAKQNVDGIEAPIGAREGALAEAGFGDRTASKRAYQANTQMLSQSITKFVISLGMAEDVTFTPLLPCGNNAEVEEAKLALMQAGQSWKTSACDPRTADVPARGLQFTRMK